MLRFLIIFQISYVENATVVSTFHVFFVRSKGKFTVSNKRTRLCKEVIKEFRFFLKVCDQFIIFQQGLNTRYFLLI